MTMAGVREADRLLIAQSFATNMPLLSGNDTLARYGVATIDAQR
jgi:PIN domain nuclease of toxin-antitoxin system